MDDSYKQFRAFVKNEVPREGVADCIRLNVEVYLGWKERLFALFRLLIIEAAIECENSPGRTNGVTHVWAARWLWPWSHRGAYSAQIKQR